MDFFFICGDPAQAIFEWKGGDPGIFIDPPTPQERTRVLHQSYRVPRQIHALSEQWIRTLSRRYPAVYLPRDHEGDIQAPQQITFKDAPRLLDHASRWIDDGKTVMFLGACGYHIDPIKHELRRMGVPFHNPGRPARGDWNPLRQSKGTSTSDRIRAFLTDGQRLWTVDELQRWVPLLKSEDVLVHGAKTKISKMNSESTLSVKDITPYFTETALRAALAGDTLWLRQHLGNQYLNTAQYILEIVERRGVQALNDTPRVIIGTIHSTKGMESTVVYVDPSMPSAAVRQWYSNDRTLRDPIIRQYYVALTRAKETLIICRGSGPSVPLPTHAPKRTEEEF